MEILKSVGAIDGVLNNYYDVSIIDDDKAMHFTKSGSDPCILFNYTDYSDIEGPVSIDVYPDIGELYDLTERLYINVKTGNLFWAKTGSKMALKYAREALYSPSYDQIVHDDYIEYVDDESNENLFDVVRIIHNGDHYTYEFERVIKNEDVIDTNKEPFNISITIRQSGSKLTPFHIPINWFYKNLQDMEEIRNKPKRRIREQ